jgi:hypothetical protein
MRLLLRASPAVQYRAFHDVAKRSEPPHFGRVAYGSRQGWHLLMMQDGDGTWPGGMLTVPRGADLVGVGTIPAYRRLLELGWDPESPPLAATKRLLFRAGRRRRSDLSREMMPTYEDETSSDVVD